MKAFLLATAVVVTASLAPPAQAQTAADDGDLKCMVVMFAIAATPTAPDQMKQFAPVGAAYFLGKVKGRSPSLDYQSRVIGLVKDLKPADLQPETARCAGELQSFGAETTVLGQKLKAAGEAASAPKP